MRKAFVFITVSLLLAGCQTPPPVARPATSEVLIASAISIWCKSLSYVVQPTKNGFVQAQAQVQNVDSSAHLISYRSEWYSEAGEMVGESNWESRAGPPGETVLITVIAYDPSATKIKLYLK
jgi:uncharacterized protein YcfL